MFMACLISYMLRVNLSINILAMVEKNHEPNITDLITAKPEEPDVSRI